MITSDEFEIEKIKIEANITLHKAKAMLLDPTYLPHTKTGKTFFDSVCDIQSIFPEAINEEELYDYVELEEGLRNTFIQRYLTIANTEANSLYNMKLGGFSSIGYLEKLIGKGNLEVENIKFKLEQNTLVLKSMSKHMISVYNDSYLCGGSNLCNEKEFLAAKKLGFYVENFEKETLKNGTLIYRQLFPESELEVLGGNK
jgi:hypothetical protein